MNFNRLTLKFTGVDAALEEKFIDHYFESVLGITRFSLFVGMIFYAAFGILDALVLPEVMYKTWFVRYAVVCPLVLGVFLFSYQKSYKKYWQPSLVFIIFSAGLGIIYMIVVAPLRSGYLYYAGLLLVILFCYTFFRTRFIWATITCWSLVLIYGIVALWVVPTPIKIIINNNFFFIATNIAGMFACYSIEYHERRNFYLISLLGEEKKKVRKTNELLHEKVQELERASAEIKTLSGLLPICSKCKKIRDDKGYWNQIEKYLKEHTEAEFTHGICPECAKKLYSVDLSDDENKK